MSQANLDLFLAEARKSQSLSEQVRAARSHEELIKLAGSHGHELTAAGAGSQVLVGCFPGRSTFFEATAAISAL